MIILYLLIALVYGFHMGMVFLLMNGPIDQEPWWKQVPLIAFAPFVFWWAMLRDIR
jgi:hypothetical protein